MSDAEPMTPYYIDGNMRALALAEERGCWKSVARYLDGDLFKKVAAAGGSGVIAELDASRKRLAAARLFEAEHGEDCLLDMDHWFNKKFLPPKPIPRGPTLTPTVKAILAELEAFDALTGCGRDTRAWQN